MENTRVYVNSIAPSYLKLWKISSEQKVLFGIMANVLKSGKANQVAIQDDEWISQQTSDTYSQSQLRVLITNLLTK